jgi:hypothetical protein
MPCGRRPAAGAVLALVYVVPLSMGLSCARPVGSEATLAALARLKAAARQGDDERAAELFADLCFREDGVRAAEEFAVEFLDPGYPKDPAAVFGTALYDESIDHKIYDRFLLRDRSLLDRCFNAVEQKLAENERERELKELSQACRLLYERFGRCRSTMLRLYAKLLEMHMQTTALDLEETDRPWPAEEIAEVVTDESPTATCLLLAFLGNGFSVLVGEEPAMRELAKALREVVKNSDEYVRAIAGEMLAELGDDHAVEPLVGLLRGSNGFTKMLAIVGLGELGTPEAIAALRDALREEKDEQLAREMEERIKNPEQGKKYDYPGDIGNMILDCE